MSDPCPPRRRPRTLAELQEAEGQDLGFGGWRDWLLVVLGVPVALGALYALVMAEIGDGRDGFLLSPTGGVVVGAVALVVGVALGASSRARRLLRERGEI